MTVISVPSSRKPFRAVSRGSPAVHTAALHLLALRSVSGLAHNMITTGFEQLFGLAYIGFPYGKMEKMI